MPRTHSNLSLKVMNSIPANKSVFTYTEHNIVGLKFKMSAEYQLMMDDNTNFTYTISEVKKVGTVIVTWGKYDKTQYNIKTVLDCLNDGTWVEVI